MPPPNHMRATGDADSGSEDDLDLDELDPIVNSANGPRINASFDTANRRPANDSINIPLQKLQKYGGSRLWRSKGSPGRVGNADEDTEGLLGSWPGQTHDHLRQWSE